MQDETDRRNMRQILIAAKMQNGKKLSAAELEFIKSRCANPRPQEIPAKRCLARA